MGTLENYTLINNYSTKEEIKKINSLNDYISKTEKENLIKAIKMKQELANKGFYIKHYKEKISDQQSYKFVAQKGSYTYADFGNNFFMPIFKIFQWLKKNGEL